MSGLSERDRRTLKIFAFALLPLFASAYGMRPLRNLWSGIQQEWTDQRQLLARERALIADAAIIDETTTQLRASLAVEERGLISAATPATAYSELANRLRTVARRQQVLVQQLSELPADSVGGGMSVLRVSIRAESDLAGLTRFIRSLESDPSRVRVSRLLIERSQQNNAGNPVAWDGRHVLVMNATVEALARFDDVRVGNR